MTDYQQEWAIIHGDIERYERFSLLIKLSAVFVSVPAISGMADGPFVAALMLILWLQDGIWKTFQQRLGTRIAFVEIKIAAQKLIHQTDDEADNESTAFQLYSQWENSRQGMLGLIKEYVANALKPTVAYPYVLLVFLVLVFF